MTKTVAITGADGLIGSRLTKALEDKYNLKLLSLEPIEGKDSIQADIADLDKMVEALQGADSVVHLAASPAVNTPWDKVLHNNIIGVYTVYEAALRAGVKQVIFASSNHAVGTYSQEAVKKIAHGSEERLNHLIPVRPDSYYGVSKVFGEAMGAYYADHKGLHVISIRIGWINPEDHPKAERDQAGNAMWMSHRDFAQMVDKCLQADNIKFDIFYGVSDNENRFYDLEHAQDVLGYIPQDKN